MAVAEANSGPPAHFTRRQTSKGAGINPACRGRSPPAISHLRPLRRRQTCTAPIHIEMNRWSCATCRPAPGEEIETSKEAGDEQDGDLSSGGRPVGRPSSPGKAPGEKKSRSLALASRGLSRKPTAFLPDWTPLRDAGYSARTHAHTYARTHTSREAKCNCSKTIKKIK